MASAILDFDLQKTYAQSIEIPELGNCALRCSDPDFVETYIVIQTVMGKSYVLVFGPLMADLNTPIGDYSLSYKSFDYKEALIEKEIKKVINDTKRKIIKIEPIDITEALKAIPGPESFIPE